MAIADVPDKKKIRQVFRNVQKHKRIEQFIRQFSSNQDDIRLRALQDVDLTGCRHVLELGCAFGAFTEVLKDRLHPASHITGLDIIPEYEPFFLQACRLAGYQGIFSSDGVDQIKKIPTGVFDLVICSFALYFFAGVIPEISRILKPGGIFITITHSERNMQELIHLTRETLEEKRLLTTNQYLPIQIIIRQFCAENGESLLKPFFGQIRSIDFKNSLVFRPRDIDFFKDYYQFKRPFFLIGTTAHKKDIFQLLISRLEIMAKENQIITMCKDDKIFICSQPSGTKERS